MAMKSSKPEGMVEVLREARWALETVIAGRPLRCADEIFSRIDRAIADHASLASTSENDTGGLLDELDALEKKATEGPWEALIPDDHDAAAVTVAVVADYRVVHPTPGYPGGNYRDTNWGSDKNDARFIAALRNAWPVLRAALSRGGVVPQGWVMVPVEPTPEMLNALFVLPDFGPGGVIIRHSVDKLPTAYQAMLAAAPGADGRGG